MFNMSGSEIIFILLMALVVLGPEKLPEAMRKAGRAYGELKRMSSSFQDEFRSQMDEPMREMRDTAELIRRNVDVGAMQVEKPKSVAAMSVDLQPDPPPTKPARSAEPAELRDPGEAAETADGSRAADATPIEPDTTGTAEEPAPPATDGFGAVPAYADHDGETPAGNTETGETQAAGAQAGEQADPEHTR